jgi:hypothetical protein
MKNDARPALSGGKRVLLATTALAAIMSPVAVGIVNTPRLEAQSPAVAIDGQAPQFEVASIKPNKSGSNRVNLDLQLGGRFIAVNVSLEALVRVAYGEEGPRPPIVCRLARSGSAGIISGKCFTSGFGTKNAVRPSATRRNKCGRAK